MLQNQVYFCNNFYFKKHSFMNWKHKSVTNDECINQRRRDIQTLYTHIHLLEQTQFFYTTSLIQWSLYVINFVSNTQYYKYRTKTTADGKINIRNEFNWFRLSVYGNRRRQSNVWFRLLWNRIKIIDFFFLKTIMGCIIISVTKLECVRNKFKRYKRSNTFVYCKLQWFWFSAIDIICFGPS